MEENKLDIGVEYNELVTKKGKDIIFLNLEEFLLHTYGARSMEEIKPKAVNGEYIDINAYDIHKEMKLLSRVPTVCAAMKKLKTDIDIIIGGEEDIPSSKFTIRYYKRNKE